MGDFTEVMEQAKRMCNAHGACGQCPLHGVSPSNISCAFDYLPGANFDEVERKIRAWVEKHSEPVYPSWEEGWGQMFPGACETPCPNDHFGINIKCNTSCAECHKRPIPADIAEKLGIKPITPEKPAPEHDGCEGCRYFDLEEDDEPCVRCKGTAGAPEVYRARRDCYELKEG